jgi:hypothetical protein
MFTHRIRITRSDKIEVSAPERQGARSSRANSDHLVAPKFFDCLRDLTTAICWRGHPAYGICGARIRRATNEATEPGRNAAGSVAIQSQSPQSDSVNTPQAVYGQWLCVAAGGTTHVVTGVSRTIELVRHRDIRISSLFSPTGVETFLPKNTERPRGTVYPVKICS